MKVEQLDCERMAAAKGMRVPALKNIRAMPYEQLEPFFDKHLHKKSFAQACAAHSDLRVLLKTAEHPGTHPDALSALAKHEDIEVLRRVAGNPNTPSDAQRELFELQDDDINIELAQHPKGPPDLLEKLAGVNPYIAKKVVENPATPIAVLRKLEGHKEWYISNAAREAVEKREAEAKTRA